MYGHVAYVYHHILYIVDVHHDLFVNYTDTHLCHHLNANVQAFFLYDKSYSAKFWQDETLTLCKSVSYCIYGIKTHGSESRGQGGSTLRRPLDERT